MSIGLAFRPELGAHFPEVTIRKITLLLLPPKSYSKQRIYITMSLLSFFLGALALIISSLNPIHRQLQVLNSVQSLNHHLSAFLYGARPASCGPSQYATWPLTKSNSLSHASPSKHPIPGTHYIIVVSSAPTRVYFPISITNIYHLLYLYTYRPSPPYGSGTCPPWPSRGGRSLVRDPCSKSWYTNS